MNINLSRHALWGLFALVAPLGLPANAAFPVVKTVPWVANNPLVPHSTYSGKTITLKGTCDRAGANLQWSWDFGDGSPPATGTVSDAYVVEASHVYTAPDNTLFTARLTIQDTSTAEIGSQIYLVEVMPKTLDIEVNIAIDEGLWYLHKTQTRYQSGGIDLGHWNTIKYGGYTTRAYSSLHAANLNALLVNGHAANGPAANPYSETVRRGLNGLLTRLTSISIGMQTNGLGTVNPDSSIPPNGIGIVVNDGSEYYQGGMVMDALVASGTPLEVAPVGAANILGRTYRDIVQDMVDAYAWAQWDGSPQGGGWRYSANQAPDNSACQWAAIGMIAAERVWGLNVPQWVKDWNKVWLAYSQNAQGWFGYTYSGDAPWGAYATTPSGMVQMALDGVGRDMPGAPSWNLAETWIRDRFANTGGATNAIKDYYYGLFSFVKSMLLHPGGPIVMLRSKTAGVPELDWYGAEVSKGAPTNGVARTLVNSQSSGGYWWAHNYTGDQYYFETAWAVMMLHQTLFEAGRPVAVPRAIPNPAIAGQIITLDGSDSFHQDGTKNVVGWEWDLDNNGTFDVSGVTVNTSFGAVGNYPVKLRITDDSVPPMSAESTMQMVIATPPVAPSAVAGGPYVFCPQAKPWFLDGYGSINPDEGRHELGCDTCPGDTIKEYAWDLDGDRDFNDAFGPTPDVTAYFTNLGPGGYNILLRVTDNTSQAYPSSTFSDLTSEGRSQVIVRESGDPGCTCSVLTGVPNGKKVVLEWTALEGASFYNIYRSLIVGGPYLWIAATDELTYTDVNVISGVGYYYVVRQTALNGDELCQSNEVMVVPVCDPAVVTCTPTQKVSNSAKYYRELTVSSSCYGRMQMRVYVGDTLNPSFASGPYKSGDVLRVVTGRPVSKVTASTVPGVAANIEVRGKMLVWSIDPLDVSSVPIISP